MKIEERRCTFKFFRTYLASVTVQMSRKFQPGKKAHCNYRDVRFSHIPTNPGHPPALIADPWSFIRNHILTLSKNKRGDGKKRLDRALRYLKLAEDFYRASETVELPTRATLIYYGMMNLVKAFISVEGVELESKIEHHGLSSPPTEEAVKIIKPRDSLSIYKAFAEGLGSKIQQEEEIDLKTVLHNIPELDNIFSSVFSAKPKYLPIEVRFLVSEENNYLFTEVSYKKEYENSHKTEKFLKGERKDYFVKLSADNYAGSLDNAWITYRSQKRKRLKTGADSNWDTLYKNISNEYAKFNICSLLTRRGYFYYCDLEPGNYHHLCYTYMAMFYLGTAARYKPLELESIMTGELRPIITEAMAICPKQFLYQMTSLILKRVCVIPYSEL